MCYILIISSYSLHLQLCSHLIIKAKTNPGCQAHLRAGWECEGQCGLRTLALTDQGEAGAKRESSRKILGMVRRGVISWRTNVTTKKK